MALEISEHTGIRHHDRVSPNTPQPTGRPNARLGQTMGDMARSIAVVLAAIGVIMVVIHRANPDPVRVVTINAPLILANMQATFPVEVPQNQSGYRLTSARFSGTPTPVWHLGYVTPDNAYVQLEQSATTNNQFLKSQLVGTKNVGSTEINGLKWTIYDGQDQDALVRIVDGVTTAVSGTAPIDELRRVAKSLATQKQTQLL
ncbi:MAG: DUF4245 family protein [Actinobacteria bacterium]|nr:DUF4245 family protein [Actinomycetota bacterium]